MKRAERSETIPARLALCICPTQCEPLESVAMISNPPRVDSGIARESLVVFALTMIGGVIRLWFLGRIGLIHFDEGIYALAGLWVFSPRGLLDLDPHVIPYAPPGFSFLVGVSYLLFGVSDVAAVLVSIVSGTLTIPAVGWVARRTFGSGAGAAAAALTALSGAHIAFSRMALVDASFLLFWVIAIGQGQRFLERPNAWRAMVLGVAVGIAQLFKYNGWVSGVIVALSAGLWLVFHPLERKSRTTNATWGWGFVAALVAAVVYWPWYQFVESHGGYSALLAHQRGYLGGLSTWPGNFSIQLDQAATLSGGPFWLAFTGLAASLGMSISRGDFAGGHLSLTGIGRQPVMLVAITMVQDPWWLISFGLISFGFSRGVKDVPRSALLLCTGWFVLSALTPFYRPYARLWLPLQAFGWIIMAAGFIAFLRALEIVRQARQSGDRPTERDPWFWTVGVVCCILCASVVYRGDVRFPRVLNPSDSIRLACRAIQKDIPGNVNSLRVFARRPVIFYLALGGGVTVFPQPDLNHLLEQGGDRSSWALLDMALMRQDNVSEVDLSRSLVDWVVVGDFPTTLNTPTLLDIEPAAARSGTVNVLASLRLLRPKRAGDR